MVRKITASREHRARSFWATVSTSGFLSFPVFLKELVFLYIPLEPAPAASGSGKYR